MTRHNKSAAYRWLALLLDPGTFRETETTGDAVITGSGNINGRPICVFAQDFSVRGGSISKATGRQIGRLMSLALKRGVPLIGIYASGGARIQDGAAALGGVGEMLAHSVRCSGIIPQIALVLGHAAGGAAYAPALCDFVFAVRNATHMYLAGPDVVRSANSEEITHADLGGAAAHSRKSGVAHFIYDSEAECLHGARQLMSYLPQNNAEQPPHIKTPDVAQYDSDTLAFPLVPTDTHTPYDMKRIIAAITDTNDFMETQSGFAPNIICAFVRLGGHAAGVVASQPQVLAGAIDGDAAVKAARFVRFCDSFNLPLLTLVDTPGFLPGAAQEHSGIIRHGAKLVYAYAEASVPKITIITRKAYGGAFIALGSRSLGSDVNYAWQGAEIAVMGAEAAVNIIHRKELSASSSPDETRKKLVEEYRAKSDPRRAIEEEHIDAIIDPRKTRPLLIQALERFLDKQPKPARQKHGNIPL
ncbi:MAG: acyl-CoA carboxylase subunit beta [Dehalococcoidia bacterium]|nr:acyl-CoA carboxylase subunit beta [Dehalococcoidia bacterium]